MNSSEIRNLINHKLRRIYKENYSNKELYDFSKEIVGSIKKFN